MVMLQAKKNPAVGRYASSAKYDLLAALGVAGFAKCALSRDLAHRLSVLLVARYDWARDALSIGHAQLAQMWSCDLRRVKRVIADLKRHGLLSVKHVGVKGRVTVYRFGVEKLAEITRPCWALLGSDYVERLGRMFPEGGGSSSESTPPSDGDRSAAPAPVDESASEPTQPVPQACPGERIKASLSRDMSRMSFRRWIEPLRFLVERQRVVVRSASPFVADYVERVFGDAILRHARRVEPDIVGLSVR
jgi:hypothetical protein